MLERSFDELLDSARSGSETLMEEDSKREAQQIDFSEHTCPACNHKGLVELLKIKDAEAGEEKAAPNAEPTKSDKKISCPNQACEFNPQNPGQDWIPRKMLGDTSTPESNTESPTSTVGTLPKSSLLPGTKGVAITIVVICSCVAVVAFGGVSVGPLDEVLGANTQSETNGLSLSEVGIQGEVVHQEHDWSVYETGDEYVVVGVVDDKTRFLGENGTVESSLSSFNNFAPANEALFDWRIRSDQDEDYRKPEKYSDPLKTNAVEIYAYNDSTGYVVALNTNGTLAFVSKNGELDSSPYIFDTHRRATASALKFISLRPNTTTNAPQTSTPSLDAVKDRLEATLDRSAGRHSTTNQTESSGQNSSTSSSPAREPTAESHQQSVSNSRPLDWNSARNVLHTQ